MSWSSFTAKVFDSVIPDVLALSVHSFNRERAYPLLLCSLSLSISANSSNKSSTATALLPPLEDVVLVGRESAELFREVASVRRGLEGQILLHGVAMYPEDSGDL